MVRCFFLFFLLTPLYGTLWDGVYEISETPYLLQANDTVKNATFIADSSVEKKLHSKAISEPLMINMSGALNAVNSTATLSFVTKNVHDVIMITIIDDSIWRGFDSTHPMLVTVEGPGLVIISITQGKTLSFGDQNNPLYFMLYANDSAPTTNLLFTTLFSESSSKNTLLTINAKSVLGSMSSVTTNTQIIPQTNLFINGYHPGVTPRGAFGIIINDAGGINVEVIGIQDSQVSSASLLSWANSWRDVDGTPGAARIVVINNMQNNIVLPYDSSITASDALDLNTNYSAVIIENRNTKYPQLRYDPIYKADSKNLISPRPGFIVGCGGTICIDNASYLVYSGRAPNTLPASQSNQKIGSPISLNSLRKVQNASALLLEGKYSIVDQNYGFDQNHDLLEKPVPFMADLPTITYKGSSALYFTSSSANNVLLNSVASALNTGMTIEGLSWLIPWFRQPIGNLGNGSIVFSSLGQAAVIGAGELSSIFGIISSEIDLSGGQLLPNQPNSIFPIFTEKYDQYGYKNSYGKSCLLFNDDILFSHVGILHNDDLHEVTVNNGQAPAEAAYIGGDTHALLEGQRQGYVVPFGTFLPSSETTKYHRRPKMYLWNSGIHLTGQNGMALAGFDIIVDDISVLLPKALISKIVFQNDSKNANNYFFYRSNSQKPQYIVHGTSIDGSMIIPSMIDPSSHIDIVSKADPCSDLILGIFCHGKSYNFNVKGGLAYPGSDLSSVMFYLGKKSNITIGKQFLEGQEIIANSKMHIESGIVSFSTEGGLIQAPRSIASFGTGVIHLRQGGCFSYEENLLGVIAAPILLEKSTGNNTDPCLVIPHTVSTPQGVTEYDSTGSLKKAIIVDKNCSIKNAHCNMQDSLLPEIIQRISRVLAVKPFSTVFFDDLGLISVPEVLGSVEKIRIQGALPGAFIRCKGGNIGSLLIDEEPYPWNETGSLILLMEEGDENDPAVVGVGSRASIGSPITSFGANGIRLFYNGHAKIFLHDDVTIEGSGQFFTYEKENIKKKHTLEITSSKPVTITVKSGSLLDMTQLAEGSIIKMSGMVTLLFEENTTLALHRDSELSLVDSASLLVKSKKRTGSSITGSTPTVTFVGKGRVTLDNDASIVISENESLFVSTQEYIDADTDVSITLHGGSTFLIGDEISNGGFFVVGDPKNKYVEENKNKSSCSINIDGYNSKFTLGKSGFFGIGVGCNRRKNDGTWDLIPFFNVDSFLLDVVQGTFDATKGYQTNDPRGSLIALKDDDAISVNMNVVGSKNNGDFSSINYNPHTETTSYFKGGSWVQLVSFDDPENPQVMHGILRSAPEWYFTKEAAAFYLFTPREIMEKIIQKPISIDSSYMFAVCNQQDANVLTAIYTVNDSSLALGEQNYVVYKAFPFSSATFNNYFVAIANGFAILYKNARTGDWEILPN